MRRNSTVVVFGIFVLVLLIIVGERVATTLKPAPLPPRPLWAPDFDPSDPAPDFELPDAKGKPHRLSRLTEGATFVGFAGEDEQSVRLFRYLGALRKRMGQYAPRFITIATFSPDREAEFRRRTDLPQIILYEKKGGPVANQYKADPAPRVFALSRQGTVRSVGLSRMEASMVAIANTAALDLGFKAPNSPDVDKRAPAPEGLDATDPMAAVGAGAPK
jgi:peroxiredoxin